MVTKNQNRLRSIFEKYFSPPFLNGWTRFEKIWLLVFGLIVGGSTVLTGGSLISLVAAITGMVCVVLVAKRRISNYAWGVVNVGLYGWIALQSQLFGEVMLNWVFFLPLQFIGYYYWKNNISNDLVDTNPVSKRAKIALAIGSVAAVFVYGFFLQTLNGNLPFFDATSTVFSVIAQILMAKRMTEQWALWAVVDVVSIGLWVWTFLQTGTGLSLAVMWLAYLVNTGYGYYMWSPRFGGDAA